MHARGTIGRGTRGRRRAWAAVAVAVALVAAGCGDSDDGDDGTTTNSTTTTTTEAPPSTATATTITASTAAEDPGTDLEPGDPCSLEEGVADCIDPEGDGEGTYLLGGGDCIAESPDIGLCADLDGDGDAGYPDSASTEDETGGGDGGGETADLPECGDAIPLPCRNPDGSVTEP